MSAEANLKKLNIDLPNAPKPVGDYVAYKKIDNLVFISGQVSFAKDGKLIVGKVGEDLTLEQGQEAAGPYRQRGRPSPHLGSRSP